MRRVVLAVAFLLGLVAYVAPAHAKETPIPPAPTRWVTDQAGFLAEPTRAALDARLEAYQKATGHQVIVWIGTTLGGAPLEEWAAKAFSAWGIGRKGKDDGVAIFVFATDRKIRIEVGYGVEDVLPDAYASRIIREVMEPALAAGHNDEAITHAVDQVLSRVGGEVNGVYVPPLAPRPVAQHSGGLPWWVWLIILVGGLGFVITHPRAAWLFLQVIASSGGGGGGWGGGGGGGGGGGFSGGGGRSGGGGASGGW